MASQRPHKRARKNYSGVTHERIDPYSHDIVHTRESSRTGGQTSERRRSSQKGATPWEAPHLWCAGLNLVDDPDLGLVDEVEDHLWEDFGDEEPVDGAGRAPEAPKTPKKPKVRQFVGVAVHFLVITLF